MGSKYVDRTGRAIRLLVTPGRPTSRLLSASSAQGDGNPIFRMVAGPMALRQPRVPGHGSRAISEFAQRRSAMPVRTSVLAGARGEKEQYADI
jgi:hypothetical protein